MSESVIGGAFALAAFLWWGLSPIYWKYLSEVSAYEVLGHRIVGSAITAIFIVAILKRGNRLFVLLRNPKVVLSLAFCALLIFSNWYSFVYCITHGITIEASLGYFLAPLIAIFLARIFLGERPSVYGTVAIIFAIVGVLARFLIHGSLPYMAIFVASTFAVYALVRKKLAVSPFEACVVECLVGSIPFVFILWNLEASGAGHFLGSSGHVFWLLLLAGPFTLVPIIFYNVAIDKTSLSLVSFLQFLGPSLNFLTAIFFLGENPGRFGFIPFYFVWIGLGIYIWDTLGAKRRAFTFVETIE